MRSLTINHIARLLNQPQAYSSDPICGYCVDSRLLQPGNLFFALKGDRVDGHQFLDDIAAKGAIAAVVSKTYVGNHSIPLICVEDPLRALQEIAKQLLAQSASRVIGITGSLGKTTTKDFVRTLLAGKYQVGATPGNSNSQIGIPLAILNHTTGNEEILVLEMGMTLPGQIAQLVQMAPPEVAVLTTAALVHACNFHSIEGIVRAKSEIFQHPNTRLGICSEEIPLIDEVKNTGASQKWTFSLEGSCGADFFVDQDEQVIIERNKCEKISFKNFLLPGAHNLHNLMAAVAVARYFNVPIAEIEARLSLLQLPEKRLELIQKGKIVFLNDSYNAAEMSVKAALAALPEPSKTGQKIAVLGSMMELGKFSDECHYRVGEYALEHVEKVYCLGEECRPIYELWKKKGKSVELFLQLNDLTEHLKKVLKPHDVVLLKGSRSKELWKVLEEF